MSRRGTQAPLISKSMFDVLGDDNEHEEEEEEEEIEEIPVTNAAGTTAPTEPSAPLSKSARKRLARLASKSAETANSAIESAKQTVEAVTESLPLPAIQQNGDKPEEGKELDNAIAPAQEEEPKLNGHQESAFPTSASTEKVIDGKKEDDLPKSTEAVSKVPTTPKFHPTLPESLPQHTANVLPSNRKRKQPQDFEPSGPGNTPTPTSPSKLGVKFEDGLAPGEGEEGEKTISTPPKKALLPQLPVVKKDRNVIERTTWTFIMIGGFIGLLCMGHPYMILLVMLCQALVYKEVTALFDLRDHGANKVEVANGEKGDKWSKTLNWYFFVVCNYFLYGESIIYYFKHIVFVDAYFIPFARNHRFISFMLYVVGFVGFVANLQRQYLRQQFALFCWVHISLLLIVVSSHFIVNNILEGLIWFFVPASLVICNDVMAYVCGKLFGRTPLIKLSPKKTVEGFVGAFICTLLFGLAWGTFFMRFPYMICPARDLGTNVLSHITCRPNPVFVWRDFEFTGPAKQVLSTILGHAPPAIPYAPFQIHVLVMATFASLVAPFGGFFASGFKRAFNIKDFGHSIPGHGGMTDRMDCQFMMGLFSYVYYSSLIRIQYITVGSIMQTVVTSLTASEQLELLADLKRFLEGQGLKA
ncbi:uncharacterized protein I206_101694 [Kwoniella pini CBS 10737]|uniref:Phosphatidate cytidylyltransferase n=1 Tax=Kwoniella pini CBS 10737 TaxID=1296096 RepID=A0A1B9HVY3_9TREE|nr:phosphatidate cytidylyltransferase [Kwoniella pini CBS 10737]OCF47437.1 phosphatidate cytidylyltransferase [Kwoniella pini CBS 10737]